MICTPALKFAARTTKVFFACAGVCVGMAFLTLGAGCKDNPKAAGADAGNGAQTGQVTTSDMNAVDLYNAGLYRQAKAMAESQLATTKGRDHEILELTAGLSAHALKQPSVAQHYLQELTGSSDPQIAGRAEAVLGQIEQSRGNHKYAADLFKRASTKLEGNDAAQAELRAGASTAAYNRPPASSITRAPLRLDGLSGSTSSNLVKPGTGGFVIQAGVFADKSNADRRARELAANAAKAGLGAPRVVPDQLNGKSAFAVHLGRFSSRQDAVKGREKLGNGSSFVIAAANP